MSATRAHADALMRDEDPITVEGVDEERLGRLVELFYARVRRDPVIGPLFNEAIDDWPGHLDKLKAFWSSVMSKSGRYKGRPLPAHVKHGRAIGPASFERWLALWRGATAEVLPPAAAAAIQQKAERIAASLLLGIQLANGRSGFGPTIAGGTCVFASSAKTELRREL